MLHKIILIIAVVALLLPASTVSAGEKEGIGETGTDPRDFATKFMPYYRYTELENGLEQQELVMFGLIPLGSPKVAITYEIPLGLKRDVDNTALKDPATGLCGGFLPGGGSPTLPNGLPAEGDCEETGSGDMNVRIIAKAGHALGGDWLYGTQIDFPTATDDVLGGGQVLLGPMLIYVKDMEFWPGPGAFAAFMNFYFFDVFGESDRPDTSMYVGRWFFMLPLHPSGIYALPEFQPIYDFENDNFSFWVGPEVGKLLAPGKILYVKPGWGVKPDSNSGERQFTFEVGFRMFL